MLDSIKVVANIPPRMMITANGLKEKNIGKGNSAFRSSEQRDAFSPIAKSPSLESG